MINFLFLAAPTYTQLGTGARGPPSGQSGAYSQGVWPQWQQSADAHQQSQVLHLKRHWYALH